MVSPPRVSLEDAALDRKVSGDLVVHVETLQIVQDKGWLWGWEFKNPDCYAQKMMHRDREDIFTLVDAANLGPLWTR
mgnify:CR=1 FL=1